MEKEAALNVGDVCRDCQKVGLEKYLRYFKINLNGDTLLKCESNECMFPYNDEMYSSDEEDEQPGNVTNSSNVTFINDFIQQYNNQTEIQNTNNDFEISDNVTEERVQFDITFLDDINKTENIEICKPEISYEKYQYSNNTSNAEIIQNKYLPLPCLNPIESELPSLKSKNDEEICIKMPEINATDQSMKNCKRKIDIQSIETIKFETPLYHNLHTLAKTLVSKNPNSPDTTNTVSESLQISSTNRKSCPKSKKTVSKKKTFKTTTSTSLEVPVSNNKASTQSVIPKADIIKGNALLKKLAEINEKSVSIRKKSRNERSAKNVEISNKRELIASSSTDSDYSFAKLSEMLTNKVKRDSTNN